jgi:NAD(P)H-quinone oxidoreductase subunit 5
MSSPLYLTVHPEYSLLAPGLLVFALCCIGLLSEGRQSAITASRVAAGLFLSSLICGFVILMTGPSQLNLAEAGPFSLSLRLDALSAIMVILISFLGLVVTRYSVNYLDGDVRQARFSRWLCATVCSALLLVLSGNLVQFSFFWLTTSLCLHQLLTFYPDRRSGMRAAKQKFFISRCSEICLFGAILLTWKVFGSFEFSEIFAKAAEHKGTMELHLLCGFLALAALMRSAQFPFHTWLPDTMDTPTPVSALMHAGIINAGGFLMVRMSPVMVMSSPTLNILALTGAFTAIFAGVVMMTQTSIKRSLAWSTISQMGFMMLQCGLGAFALAVLHIVAHSLYKAHAFLSSGSIVSRSRSGWVPTGRPATRIAVLVFSLAASVVVGLGVGALLGVHWDGNSGIILLGSIFMMAVAHLLWTLWSSSFRRGLFVWGIVITSVAAASCFGLHSVFTSLLAGTVPDYSPNRSLFEYSIMGCIGLLFMAVLVFQSQMSVWSSHQWFRRLYVQASNGFYVGARLSRLFKKLSLQ